MELTEEAKTAIESLRRLFESLREQVSKPLEWPLPATCLDLEGRASEPARIFKHIQQMCLLHTSSFQNVNQIKLVYLIEAYLAVADVRTPLGIYSAARSLLEFAAFTSDVARRLSSIRDAGGDWLTRGKAFFGTIVRAAFGTSDPKALALLLEGGTAKEHTKPFRIGESIKAIGLEGGFEEIPAHYNTLCDFVHHNLSSGTTTATSIRQGTIAHSHGGGMLLLTKPGPIVCRGFPAPDQAIFALNQTAKLALKNAQATVRRINECPESPYTRAEILENTGHEFGMRQLDLSEGAQSPSGAKKSGAKTGRNEPCPCGSGRKFKRCCQNTEGRNKENRANR